jgi:hypothetical protein
MLSTGRALAFHWWILDLQRIGRFFTHVPLIVFRSGDVQTVDRCTELRLHEEWFCFNPQNFLESHVWNKKGTLANKSFQRILTAFVVIEREHGEKQVEMNGLHNFRDFCFFIRWVFSSSNLNIALTRGNCCFSSCLSLLIFFKDEKLTNDPKTDKERWISAN